MPPSLSGCLLTPAGPRRRYITCEADKSIKVYREDDEATPETHPVDMKRWREEVLRYKRF